MGFHAKILIHPDHDGAVLRAPNDGGEDRSWSIVAREAGLATLGQATGQDVRNRIGQNPDLPYMPQTPLVFQKEAALHMPLPLSTTRAVTSSDMAGADIYGGPETWAGDRPQEPR